MSLLFASSYIGSFKIMAGAVAAANTLSLREDAYSNSAFTTSGTSAPFQIQTPDFLTELTEGWAHVYMNAGSNASNKIGNFFGFYDSVNNRWQVVAWITNVSSVDYVEILYWNGSAMVSAGAAVSMGSTGGHHYDLYFRKHGSTGQVSFYRGDSLLFNATGLDLSTITVNCARWRALNSYLASAALSQFIVSEESTVGARVFTKGITNGSLNTMAGGAVADLQVSSMRGSNSFITGDTDGQLITANVVDISSSLEVMGVAINTRSRRGTTGPSKLEMIARVDGDNFFSDEKNLTLGTEPVSHVFDNNPDTGLTWSLTQVNDSEFGLRVKT
jgi:hypothetical protein